VSGSGGPLSLLVVSTILARGGAERFVATLLRHLDRERVRPELCLLREEVGYPLPEDVEVTRLGYRSALDLPRTIRRLRRLIEAREPAVVLGNITATNLACGMALAGIGHAPRWIARIGSSPRHLDGPVRAFLARRVLPAADLFVVNSSGLVAGLEAFYPFTAGRIRVLANPTDFERIDRLALEPPVRERTGGGPVVLAVGRLFPEKRHDLMLEAVARVRRELPLELWICGEGPGRRGLEREIIRRGLSGVVHLLGFCENPFALMRQADVFLMSSDHEGLPNALIEAQGLGLPAVSTRCPYGPQDIVEHERTGLLVPVGDVEALAAALLELLRDAGRRGELARAARVSIRARFSAPELARAWQQLILEVGVRGES